MASTCGRAGGGAGRGGEGRVGCVGGPGLGGAPTGAAATAQARYATAWCSTAWRSTAQRRAAQRTSSKKMMHAFLARAIWNSSRTCGAGRWSQGKPGLAGRRLCQPSQKCLAKASTSMAAASAGGRPHAQASCATCRQQCTAPRRAAPRAGWERGRQAGQRSAPPHHAGPLPDIFLDQLAANHADEAGVGAVGHRARQQRLACARSGAGGGGLEGWTSMWLRLRGSATGQKSARPRHGGPPHSTHNPGRCTAAHCGVHAGRPTGSGL